MADDKPTHGTFCWNELVSRDVPVAEKFYTELLGWKTEDSGMAGMKYTIFKTPDKGVAGLMAMPAEVSPQVPSHWMSYVAVDDVDSLAEKTKELGGQIIHGPADIPNVGRFCIIQDPAGAVISLIKMS